MTSSRVAPPPRYSGERTLVRGVTGATLFAALGSDALRNMFTLPVTIGLFVALALVAGIVALRQRPSVRRDRLPVALGAYVLVALLSVLWSQHLGATLLTLVGLILCTMVGTLAAVQLSWRDISDVLARVLALLLGGSIAFELIVAVVIRGPVLPVGVAGSAEDAPLLDLWSRNLLFSTERIQGLPGNANVLGFLALLGLIVFALRVAGPDTRYRDRVWVVIAALLIVKTGSSTVLLALAALAATGVLVTLIRRSQSGRTRVVVTMIGAGSTLLVAALALLAPASISGLLGKSGDLTGRADIWRAVTEYGSASPVVGMGFSSPWVPWVAPFGELAVRNDVVQLQAHSAWVDVQMQLGIIGVVLLGAVIVSTSWRSWFIAVDRPRYDIDARRPYTAASLLPLGVLVALAVQSLSESHLLYAGGWTLLVLFAVKTKQEPLVDRPDARDSLEVVLVRVRAGGPQ